MDAMSFAKDHDEVSIYSLHDGVEIPTGGTGGFRKAAPVERFGFGDEMTDEEIASLLNQDEA